MLDVLMERLPHLGGQSGWADVLIVLICGVVILACVLVYWHLALVKIGMCQKAMDAGAQPEEIVRMVMLSRVGEPPRLRIPFVKRPALEDVGSSLAA